MRGRVARVVGKMQGWARRALSAFRASLLSIADPAFRELLSRGWYGGRNYSGVEVTENSAVSSAAVWRACSLIAGTLAQLPLRTISDQGNGMRKRMKSWLDDPGKYVGLTPFQWKEMAFWHLLLHGNAYGAYIVNEGGALVGLSWLHPLCVRVELARPGDPEQPVGGKWFYATLADGSVKRFDGSNMLHVMGVSLDGIQGISVLAAARNSIGTLLAGDQAAARMFGSGLSISGIVTPSDGDLEPEEATSAMQEINDTMTGDENFGKIAVLNKSLTFTKMTMSAQDAQFLESRQFSIEEIARWFGVPPFELMQTDKQTSWGTGIEAQQRGLGRTTLAPWAVRFEEKLSTLLPNPRFAEFDFAGIERPDPATEIGLLISEIDGGIMTINEARAVRNLPPVEGGEVLRLHGEPIQAANLNPTSNGQASATMSIAPVSPTVSVWR